ncbi:MAG: 5-(carboxyamino)imidazole ribonucleotide synthase [Chlorobi bacterium]|nr:5-(carboxyamino)imidazole ribonucleotide synthase [Chlorobiota bacterium]
MALPIFAPMKPTIPTIGILGGGQLARMTAYAAFQLGLRVHIMERFAGSPAGQIAHREVIGDPSDHELLLQFASECTAVTLESEFINEEHLVQIERAGYPLFPTAASVAKIQDKLVQKRTLREAGVPSALFAGVADHDEARRFGDQHGYPFVLKSRRNGYDGYGNATIRSADEIAAGWEKITRGDAGAELYCEAFVNFTTELAVMVTRGRDGETAIYPLAETVQHNHICHYVTLPAQVDAAAAATAIDYARRGVEAIGGVGIFGVELFLTGDGEVLLNEIAPRPHNSGHYSIEGAVTSQFENHLRAVMGWPLGSTNLRAPGVAMANILGRGDGAGAVASYPAVLSSEDAHLHIYGKLESRKGRKMGHVTALAATPEEALAIAARVESAVDFSPAG